ncbi:MAG: T9SS type A sorting domain-containing protein [Bacteroidetes bacterium]|nr:T9SS type A sorting domain-containing protein [Bacteroidota bacterium]
MTIFKKTLDGGYIVGGNTYSADGIITDHHGTSAYDDVWIYKVDSNFNLEWAKSYGGALHDRLFFIDVTPEGNFMVGATTNSTNGDVSESLGDYDFWIFKIDADGNLLWEKSFGGSGYDYLLHLRNTDDGGVIVVGDTESTDGDVIGHDPLHGRDSWVIKLNINGDIEWQKCLGGTGDDHLRSITFTSGDNGYLFTGYTYSNDFDVFGNHGASDIWLIKLDHFGNILWQKCLGGTYGENSDCTIETADGGFIMVGSSNSDNGDVANHFGSSERPDVWVVKLNNTGVIEWEKNYGGNSYDYGSSIVQVADGGYIMVNSTSSTGGDILFTHGGFEGWLCKINSVGVILWQVSVGGSKDDYFRDFLIEDDGSYIIAGSSDSEDGDVDFNYGNLDTWMVKLSPACYDLMEICNTLDDNCNGLIDDGITETIDISAGGPITFCQGGNVLLTATYSGTTVQWKKNGTNIPGATAATYTVTTKGNYSCVTTSDCGSAESTTIFVNVIKNPNASISAGGPTTFCAGGSVVLTEVAVAGCTYQWYKGATPIAGATSLNYTASTSGNYKCRVTKAATGCFKNSNAIVVSVPCKENEDYLLNIPNVDIYPNPNNGTFTLSYQDQLLPESSEIILEIYNSYGQIIFIKNLLGNAINETISLTNIAAGIYIARIYYNNNYIENKLFVE